MPAPTAVRPRFAELSDVFRLLWSEIDPFIKRRFAIAVALVVAAAVATAAAPIALQLIVDGFAGGASARAYITPALLIGAYVLSQFLSRAFGEARVVVHGEGEQRLHRRVSARLFSHVMQLPLRYHLDRKSGAIGQTLATGLAGFQMMLQHCLYTLLPVAVEFTTICVVLARLDRPIYVLILVVTAAAYLAAFTLGAVRITGPTRAMASAHIHAHGLLSDSLLNYETVKYFNGESAVSHRYETALAETESQWKRFYRAKAVNGLLVATIFTVSVGTSLFCAGHDVMGGAMTVGEFVLVNAYVLRIAQPLESAGGAVRDLSQSLAYLMRMMEIFREAPEPAAAVHAGGRGPARGELVFDHVRFSYLANRVVLRDVSFSVPAGKTVAIVGVSGSGKSSLVRLLFRLYELDSGRILLDGEPTSGMRLSTLRQAIAVVPQDTVLFNDTIASNIGFGRRGSTQQEIEAAARLAHLHEFIASLPDGYATTVGERGLKLSGGEKQRVAIARAALKEPRIYVFDEATSSLDTRTERQILRNLIDVSRGCTTLVVAHRLSTVVHADEIIVLDAGTIVERGTHAQLLERSGNYASLWRAQQSERRSSDDEPSVSAA